MSQDLDQPTHPPSWLDSWHVSPSLNKDYDVIDGLRGIAIVMVVASHILYHNPKSSAPVLLLGGMINAGAYGVTVFFALSGFLISMPFWKRKKQGADGISPRGYATRRFWKIYPPLALSLILLVPVYVYNNADASYWTIALRWLAGIPLILPVEGKLNPVMWSLIVEIHFYATLPLLFYLTRKLSYKTTLIAIFALLLLIPSAFRLWNLSQGIVSTLHPLINTRYPSSLDSFALGVLIGGLEISRSIRQNWTKLGNLGLGLLLTGLFMASVSQMSGGPGSALREELIEALIKLAAGLLILFIANPACLSTRLLSASWLRWLGVVSYEWYLFHQPIFKWTHLAFGGSSGGNAVKYFLIVGISSGGSLLLAALIYRFFSLPILRWGRTRAKA